MYILFAWTLVGILHSPTGDTAVYDWVSKGSYPTKQVCQRIAHVDLHINKYRCVLAQ